MQREKIKSAKAWKSLALPTAIQHFLDRTKFGRSQGGMAVSEICCQNWAI